MKGSDFLTELLATLVGGVIVYFILKWLGFLPITIR